MLHRRVRCVCSPLPANLRSFLPWASFPFKAFLRSSLSWSAPGLSGALTPMIPLTDPADPSFRQTTWQAMWSPSGVCPRFGVCEGSLRRAVPRDFSSRRPSPSFMGFVTSKNAPRSVSSVDHRFPGCRVGSLQKACQLLQHAISDTWAVRYWKADSRGFWGSGEGPAGSQTGTT